MKKLTRRDALELTGVALASVVLTTTNAHAAPEPTAANNDNKDLTGDGRKPIVITDMGRCTPRGALSDRLVPGCWKRIAYEAAPYKGTLLFSPAENDPKPVTLPLGARGWHRVRVGLSAPWGLAPTTLLRITGQPAFIPFKLSGGSIEEITLGVYDLTGRDLEIAARAKGKPQPASIAYVRLEPLSAADGAAQAKQGTGISVSIDGFSLWHERRPESKQELWEELWRFRQTDVDHLILQIGSSDQTNYPTRVGNFMGEGQKLFPRPGDRHFAEGIRVLARKGINPTRELIDAAHACGIRTEIGLRPAAWKYYEPYGEYFESPYYRAHPEWRTIDRDGTPLPRLSFAVPAVRRHLVEVTREAVSFGADGACVMFNRGTPLVLYEKPFADAFRARFGREPGEVADDAPEMLALRAAFVGSFLRELRAMLDDEGKKAGRRLTLSAIALGNEADNRYYGIDLRAWIRDGLIDSLTAWPADAGRERKGTLDLDFFREICAPKNIPFRPALIGWQMERDPRKLAAHVAGWYAKGSSGITVWDANAITDEWLWQPMTRFGSRERTEKVAESGAPPRVTVAPQQYGDVRMGGRFRADQGF
jgi:hypothetical protein